MTEPIRAPNVPMGTVISTFLGLEKVGDKESLKRFNADSIIGGARSGGGVVFTTKAQADANLNYDAYKMAWVMLDPTPFNSGVYQKSGVSGAGSWSKVAELPYSFYRARNVGEGTANAIRASHDLQMTSPDALISFNVTTTNTSPIVTIKLNNDVARPILTASGFPPVAGGLVAGMVLAGYIEGSNFRLLSDQATAAIVPAAEAAAAAALASALAALQRKTEVDAALGAVIGITTGKPIVLLFYGQSNMTYSFDNPAVEIPANLFFWNGGAHSVGTAFIPAPAVDRVSIAAAILVARANPFRPVYVINIAEGSQPVEQWLPPPYQHVGSGYYDMMYYTETNVVQALALLNVPYLDMAIGWVGESDAFAGIDRFLFKGYWNLLHARWRTKPWFRFSTPMIAMGYNPYDPDLPEFSRYMREWCDAEPATRSFVDSSKLPSPMWVTPPHMTAAGYSEAGRLAFQIMSGLSSRSAFSDNYQKGLITNPYPTISFDTPGNLAIAVPDIQSGDWQRNGDRVTGNMNFRATIGFSTAAGSLRVLGLPYRATTAGSGPNIITLSPVNKPGYTQCIFQPVAGQKYGTVRATSMSGLAMSDVLPANLTSGEKLDVFVSFDYFTNDWFDSSLSS